jgi:histidine triad (HIT) family protein
MPERVLSQQQQQQQQQTVEESEPAEPAEPVPEPPANNVEASCLFCKIVAGDIPATVIASDERTVTFLDINPATPGHALVVPRTHARDLLDISADDLSAVTTAAQLLACRQTQVLGAGGVNLINSCGAAAWQDVFHFHMHVIPRFKGDGLTPPWTGSPANQEELGAIGAKLRSAMADD